MNIQQLKELAKLADSEVTWILLPKDLANDGWCTEVVNYISVVSPSTITALVDRIEAAERERDELRLEIARIGGAKSIEVLRRDAAAGEPYGYVHKSLYEAVGSAGLSNDHEAYRDSPTHIALYTAAQPAVLPHKLSMDTDPELQGDFRVHEAIRRKGFNQALDAALELGAQQQKVVELPALFNLKMAGDVKTKQYFKGSNDTIKQIAGLLDAASVKWEVKK